MQSKLLQIDQMNADDWPMVARIYREGIETGIATFEQNIPRWEQWDEQHIRTCRLVARYDRQIVGWAALSPVSSRCVYGGVAEISVYVAANARGEKIGEQLLRTLIAESEKQGYWTLQSGIFPENVASIGLHKKCGFRKIGYRERIGRLNGIWKDNILMEKRSEKTGQGASPNN